MMFWQPGQPVRINTERFVLRSLTPQDATERFAAWTADPEVSRFVNVPPRAVPPPDLLRFIQGHDNDRSFGIGIFDRASGLHIGLLNVNVDKQNRLATTDVMIGERDWWGARVVLEARGALYDFLFDTAGVEKICGLPLAGNNAAIFNYRAQGFRLEGLLRRHRLSWDGRTRLDQYQFGMLREEWHARRKARR